MTSRIILGCPFKDLGEHDLDKILTKEQYDWSLKHVFYIGGAPFFGTVIDEWHDYKIGLSTRLDDLVYVERKLREELKSMLDWDFNGNFYLIGVTDNG